MLSYLFSQISAPHNEFGAKTSPILSKLVELGQVQKFLIGNTVQESELFVGYLDQIKTFA